MKVYVNGSLVDKKDAKVSVFDHGLLYGDGVFEGIRRLMNAVNQFLSSLIPRVGFAGIDDLQALRLSGDGFEPFHVRE